MANKIIKTKISHAEGEFKRIADYELALDVCVEAQRKYRRAIEDEKANGMADIPFIDFCEREIASLCQLRVNLLPEHLKTIQKLLDKDSLLFRLK